MLDIKGRAAGAVITLATNFTISSSYDAWKGAELVVFPGYQNLGLCVPGKRYMMWGTCRPVEFRAAPTVATLVAKYNDQKIPLERVSPMASVGDLKAHIAKEIGVADAGTVSVMVKPFPTSGKGFLLSDNSLSLHVMQVGRGELMISFRQSRHAPKVAAHSDAQREKAGLNMKIEDF